VLPSGVARTTWTLKTAENRPLYEATVPTWIGPESEVMTVHVAVVSNVGQIFVR
jgi:hypothetical protein